MSMNFSIYYFQQNDWLFIDFSKDWILVYFILHGMCRPWTGLTFNYFRGCE